MADRTNNGKKKPDKRKPAKRKLVSVRRDTRKPAGEKRAKLKSAGGKRIAGEPDIIAHSRRGQSGSRGIIEDEPEIIVYSRGRPAHDRDVRDVEENPDIIAHSRRRPASGKGKLDEPDIIAEATPDNARGGYDEDEQEGFQTPPDGTETDAPDESGWDGYEPDRGDDEPEDIKRELFKIAASLVFLLVLSYIMAMLIIGYPPGLPNLFGSRTVQPDADEFFFDVGRRRGFVELGGHLAAAGTLGIQVFDAKGGETLRDALRMDDPAIRAESGRAIVFDIGGTAVRVFDSAQVLVGFDTEDRLVSASINRNGWFCVCEQDSGGYKGSVLVYNEEGRNVYKASIASGYVVSAELSRDNRHLAILTVSEDGGRVIFYNLSGEEAIGTYLLPDALILDIRFTQRGDLLAVTPQELLLIDRDGVGSAVYGFGGARLGGYTLDGGFVALHLLDYGVGYRGRIVTLATDGKRLREYDSDKEIVAMSSAAGELVVLRNDGPVVYGAGSNEVPLYGQSAATTGLTGIVALSDGSVLAAGENSAMIFRR